MKFLTAIKAWYLRTFLPFEQPDHPLYHDQAAVEAAEAELQEIWDEIEQEDMEALEIDSDIFSALTKPSTASALIQTPPIAFENG